MAKREWSAYALAKAAGVDPGMVKRYLDGKRGVTSDTLELLLAALNLRIVPTAKKRSV